jgi:nitrogen fixation NifU-like protein
MTDLMDFYSREELLEHARKPRNEGAIDGAHISCRDANQLCGDEVEIFANNNKGIISEIKFQGSGCFISRAASSLISEKLVGKSLEEVLVMTTSDLNELLGATLTPGRIKCAFLPLATLQKGIKEYLEKKKKDVTAQ